MYRSLYYADDKACSGPQPNFSEWDLGQYGNCGIVRMVRMVCWYLDLHVNVCGSAQCCWCMAALLWRMSIIGPAGVSPHSRAATTLSRATHVKNSILLHKVFNNCSPSQKVPFPVNPVSQVQMNPPTTSEQVALSWQLCVISSHSFISVNGQMGCQTNKFSTS